MKAMAHLVLIVLWISGIYLANGFWSTFFAVMIPFWAYYLSVTHFLVTLGCL